MAVLRINTSLKGNDIEIKSLGSMLSLRGGFELACFCCCPRASYTLLFDCHIACR